MGRIKAKIILKKTKDGNRICKDNMAKDKIQLISKSTTSKVGIVTSKKEKIIQKRKNLMNKFTILKKCQKEEINRKNREKTAVIGDLKPLKDALPSLNEILILTKNDLRTGVKEFDGSNEEKLSVKKKIRRKKEQFVKQVNSYHQLLRDPDFKKNPREAIRYHIQYTHGLVE